MIADLSVEIQTSLLVYMLAEFGARISAARRLSASRRNGSFIRRAGPVRSIAITMCEPSPLFAPHRCCHICFSDSTHQPCAGVQHLELDDAFNGSRSPLSLDCYAEFRPGGGVSPS